MRARLRFALAAGVLGLLTTGPLMLAALLLYAEAGAAERGAFAGFLVPRLPLVAVVVVTGLMAGCSSGMAAARSHRQRQKTR